jgi:hypothetical protein
MPIYMLIGGLVRRDMRAMLASGKLVRFAVMIRLKRIINWVLLGSNRAHSKISKPPLPSKIWVESWEIYRKFIRRSA